MTSSHAKAGDGASRETQTPFERFTEFTRRIVAVPKTEIQAQERLYQRRQRAKKRRKRKSA